MPRKTTQAPPTERVRATASPRPKVRPRRTVRARPAEGAGTWRRFGTGQPAGTAQRAVAGKLPRMPFVLLVLGLLGGGLICLLVVNTTLGATSFRISQLQASGAGLATQEETLQQQIATERSPAQIAKLAYALGMRAEANTTILDLGSHRIYRLPGQTGATGAITAGIGVGIGSTGRNSWGTASGAVGKVPGHGASVAGEAPASTGTVKKAAKSGTGNKPASPHRSGSQR